MTEFTCNLGAVPNVPNQNPIITNVTFESGGVSAFVHAFRYASYSYGPTPLGGFQTFEIKGKHGGSGLASWCGAIQGSFTITSSGGVTEAYGVYGSVYTETGSTGAIERGSGFYAANPATLGGPINEYAAFRSKVNDGIGRYAFLGDGTAPSKLNGPLYAPHVFIKDGSGYAKIFIDTDGKLKITRADSTTKTFAFE